MVKKDYMGVLVVNHYVSDKEKLCFGSQINTRSITEIALHQAFLDDQGNIQCGELISHVHMSDLQFGNIISKPNQGLGHPITLNHLRNYTIDESQIDKDPSNTVLSNNYNEAKSLSNQILGFLDDLNEINSSLISNKSKMNAKIKSKIIHLTTLIKDNSISNHKFYLNNLSQTANEKLNEAKNEVHHLIRDSYRGINQAIKLDNLLPSENAITNKDDFLSPMAKLSISHIQGKRKIFDSVAECENYISLSLNCSKSNDVSNQISKNERLYDRDRLFINDNGFEVLMNMEQYTQFVRSDESLVPCTIKSIKGESIKDTIVNSEEEDLLDSHKDNIDEILKPLILIADEIIELIENGITKKADFLNLTTLIDKLTDEYNNLKSDISNNAEVFSQDIFNKLDESLNKFQNNEIEKMPLEYRNNYKKLINFNLKNN